MIKVPSNDFLYFINLTVKDILRIAEAKHSVGAFTGLNWVLSQCYQTMTGVDPFNIIEPVGPEAILNWAKAQRIVTPRVYTEISEDLVQIIQIMAIGVDKAINSDGASFPYAIAILVGLARAYFVNTGVDLLPNLTTDETSKKLIDWAWHFRIVERQTPVKESSN